MTGKSTRHYYYFTIKTIQLLVLMYNKVGFSFKKTDLSNLALRSILRVSGQLCVNFKGTIHINIKPKFISTLVKFGLKMK